MMLRKTLILVLSVLTLVAGPGCTKKPQPGHGTVILTLSTGNIVTKTGEPTPVADGAAIAFDGVAPNQTPDLFIAIANSQGTIVATYPDNPNLSTSSALMENANATQLSVKFTDFENNGEFTVYAVANTAGGVWGAPADAAAWKAKTSASALDELTFTALEGNNIYSVNPETGRMPLSAKGTLSVNEGLNGHADIELLRCVAKVAFKFKNETGEPLTLNGCTVSIEDINPTKGFIFPQTNDVTGTARDLTLIQSETLVDIGASTDFYGDMLVFPSVAPAQTVGSRYLCNISFTVGGQFKSFTDLPIHDRQSHDITSLGRNQYLQIETRINRGLDVSFNFVVDDWNENTEDIIFH